MLDIYVDADGCPVKDEVYRVADRYGLKVFVVANMSIRVPRNERIEAIVVTGDLNAADDWIAERIGPGDIAITADIPLADRCLQKGAKVVGTTGKSFTVQAIGGMLATRDLLRDMRDTGQITGGPPPFKPADRSRFLSSLDNIIQAVKREQRRTQPPTAASEEPT